MNSSFEYLFFFKDNCFHSTALISPEHAEFLRGDYRKDEEGCDRTRGNDSKVKEGMFRMVIMKKFFTVRVVRHRNRLPRELVDTPSLEVFKACLDGAFNNLA